MSCSYVAVFEFFMPHRVQKLQVCNTQPFQISVISVQYFTQNTALWSKKLKRVIFESMRMYLYL